MEKTIIATENAPGAVGPYSQGARVGHLVYTAGQIPLDPASGQLVGADVAAQSARPAARRPRVVDTVAPGYPTGAFSARSSG
jgi:enamine deaminase RidA (YjgF/YER057c/UK114 family)